MIEHCNINTDQAAPFLTVHRWCCAASTARHGALTEALLQPALPPVPEATTVFWSSPPASLSISISCSLAGTAATVGRGKIPTAQVCRSSDINSSWFSPPCYVLFFLLLCSNSLCHPSSHISYTVFMLVEKAS